jgi:hypothetical protein
MVFRAPALAFSCVLAAVGVLGACGENGVTPSDCPALPLYDPQETGPTEDEEIAAELAQAVEAGCATRIGTARIPGASGGSGGTTATGGSEAGAGGSDH